ncbi:dihydrofolate reductase family protein [Streptacidiphilus jiangxiensis]|uniref:Riboflavin biosynthesis protein RibD n=1 Tax=Streptacidiphilus jiangxiensis TaxID=235985 RepID=A0A1H7S1C5_STRJI|nr:dihydrofolate reductase family protein [Streptacidiphilus jiangxiensis]SEL66401.1 5-amino-6-(5-phosphoribosylamino)uracil reductase [Streptacidiphilus jiangxiensis]
MSLEPHPARPSVLISAAMSVDGHIDDAAPERLLLSSPEDFDRVDALRAAYDAILVGAGTLRADDPRLEVRDEARRAARVARGLPEHPLKVALVGHGGLAADLRLWQSGGAKLVLAPDAAVAGLRAELGERAEVVGTGAGLDPARVLDALAARGVRRLMVEGGGAIQSLFLTAGLVDEIQLALAPFFVGDAAAPRFAPPVAGAVFPQDAAHRMTLLGAQSLGDLVVLRYAARRADASRVTTADVDRMRLAIELSRECPASETAYSVGAVIVAADGTEIACGFSREGGDDKVHAEESALGKIDLTDPRLRTATIYSTLEPCSVRASRPHPCAELIRAAGIGRVVLAWREPALFVADCQGVELLEQAGATVVEIPALAEEARAVNAHLVSRS